MKWISQLSAEELRGWIWGVAINGREYFPGERAALMDRAKKLGVSI